MTAEAKTTVRIDYDATNSTQLDSLHRIIHWLDEMRTAGWIVHVDGHLTGSIARATLTSADTTEAKK